MMKETRALKTDSESLFWSCKSGNRAHAYFVIEDYWRLHCQPFQLQKRLKELYG